MENGPYYISVKGQLLPTLLEATQPSYYNPRKGVRGIYWNHPVRL